MNEISLDGCTPTPLACYLKALGMLRLLSGKYPGTRGFWRNDRFVLRTELDRDAIEHFFLFDYEPTPLVAPWGARSGFYEGAPERTAREALSRIEASDKKQLQNFRKVVQLVRNTLQRHGIREKATDEKKLELLRICRSELPDDLLDWLDTCYVLTGEDRKFPPLLGTGGNEGSGSYVSGFAQQIAACIVDRQHDAALSAALFNSILSDTAVDQTPGHFSPVDAGGLNASVGFEDNRARVNPWDYILALEGAVAFAGAAVRRNADDPAGVMSYPFTVRAIGAGSGSLSQGDIEKKPRGELWMPLWSQPATYAEVRALMAEGRVALGKQPARDALDFVRAVQHLGGYRGIKSFQRFGLLMRSGKAYLATPLSRVEVNDEPRSRWLDDLDKNRWLERFRQFAKGENTANRFPILCKRLEDKLFAFSAREPSKAETQSLLVLLGEIQSALSSSQRAREATRPVPELSEHWVIAADDGSTAFRIAKALAGISKGLLPLRTQLFPLQYKRDQWMTPDASEQVRFHVGQKGRLTDTLCALLAHRLWLAEKLVMRDKPLASPSGATLEDINAFLRDGNMDERIAALMPGLALCDIPHDAEHSSGTGVVPAAFALLKLCLTPDRILHSLKLLPEGDRLPVAQGMLAQLASGNQGNRAVTAAWRRLRASGLAPIFSQNALPSLNGIGTRRAAAALLIPLRYGATAALARSVVKLAESKTETA